MAKYDAYQKAGVICWRLFNSEKLLTSDVARCTGLKQRGALHMMRSLEKVLPIVFVKFYWMKKPGSFVWEDDEELASELEGLPDWLKDEIAKEVDLL